MLSPIANEIERPQIWQSAMFHRTVSAGVQQSPSSPLEFGTAMANGIERYGGVEIFAAGERSGLAGGPGRPQQPRPLDPARRRHPLSVQWLRPLDPAPRRHQQLQNARQAPPR